MGVLALCSVHDGFSWGEELAKQAGAISPALILAPLSQKVQQGANGTAIPNMATAELESRLQPGWHAQLASSGHG